MKHRSNYLNEVLVFFKRPNTHFYHKLPILAKIKYLNFSFLLIFAGAFLSALLTNILEISGAMPKFQNLAVPSLLKNYNIFIVYIITILIAPIIEELAFRTLLVFSKINLAVSSGFLFYILASSFAGSGYTLSILTYYKIFGGITITTLVSMLLNNHSIFNRLKSLWEGNFALVFYTSAVVFAYLHLLNFGEIELRKIVFSPIIVLPFFVYAITLGFVRVKLGLHWAIILHIMLNLFVRLLKIA